MPDMLYREYEALLIMKNNLMNDLESRMKKVGLSSNGFLALRLIQSRSKPRSWPCTRADIAQHLGISPPSVTSLVARMIDQRWVETSWINDRNEGLIITESGRNKVVAGMAAWQNTFDLFTSDLNQRLQSNLMKAVTAINVSKNHRIEEAHDKMILKNTKVRRYRNSIREHNAARKQARKQEIAALVEEG